MFCANCGAEVLQGEKFCDQCGNCVEEETAGPFRYLSSHIKSSVMNIGSVFKSPRALIAMAVMLIVWVVFSLLPLLGVNPMPVQIASLLTFSQGGLYDGVHGALGGILGKVFFAYLAMPLLAGYNPFKGVAAGFRHIPAAFSRGVPPGLFFLGLGIAPIMYNFMAGSASLMKIMAAFAGFLLALRAMGRQEGFLRGFVSSLLNAYAWHGGAAPYNESVLAGLAAGFLISIPLSLFVFGYVCYFVGLGLLIIGAVLQLVLGGRRRVPAV